MISKKSSNAQRIKRHLRVRKNISGTPARPRLNVYRSLSNIYAQIIDDTTGKTLVSASSLDKEIKEKVSYGGNKEAAKEVGALIAKRALEKNQLIKIKIIIFHNSFNPHIYGECLGTVHSVQQGALRHLGAYALYCHKLFSCLIYGGCAYSVERHLAACDFLCGIDQVFCSEACS